MGGSKSKEPQETAAEKANAEVAKKQWNLYKKELKQFEQAFIQRVDNTNSQSNMADTKQHVDLSYARNYSQARDATADNMAASGIDPSSGKFQGAMSKLTTEQGVKQGDTINRSQSAEQDKYIAGLQDVVAIGQGQKAESLAGLNDMASLSAEKAHQDAINSFNTKSAMAQTVGTVAGAGAAYGLRNATQSSFNDSTVDGVSTVKPINTYDPMTNPDGTMYS